MVLVPHEYACKYVHNRTSAKWRREYSRVAVIGAERWAGRTLQRGGSVVTPPESSGGYQWAGDSRRKYKIDRAKKVFICISSSAGAAGGGTATTRSSALGRLGNASVNEILLCVKSLCKITM